MQEVPLRRGAAVQGASNRMKFSDIAPCPVDAYQNLNEFGNFWDFVEAREPRRVLEVGSLFGGTLWYWSHLPLVEQLITVDLPSDWERVAAGVREARPLWAEWMDGIDFHDFRADSQQDETVEAVIEVLTGRFDLAFIDGDHSEAGVRRDLELWSPLVRDGGLVAFHDTVPNGNRHEPGVVALCADLKWKYPSVEFFDPDGVGICAFVV